jgi:predicted 3-demethylubiquinone-9 3-methyltransferase (glyoxalase superfamily)
MVTSCTPFLMFTGEGAEALRFYETTLPGAEARVEQLYGEGEALPAGALKAAFLKIAGQELRLFDSPPGHAFTFTPAISFFLECAGEEELRSLAERLAEGGQEFMPVGEYGFSRLYAWVGDRFGITWQLNLA